MTPNTSNAAPLTQDAAPAENIDMKNTFNDSPGTQVSATRVHVAIADKPIGGAWTTSTIDWTDIADKWLNNPSGTKKCFGFVGGALRGTQRTNSTVLQRDFATVDVDHGHSGDRSSTVARLRELGLGGYVYPSYRDGVDGEERFRVLVPFSAPVSADAYGPATRELVEALGLADRVDKVSYTPGQFFYGPAAVDPDAFTYSAVDGSPFAPALQPETARREPQSAEPADYTPEQIARGNAYVTSAVQGELARLEHCQQAGWGTQWDATTFSVACNLLELANASWNSYTEDDAEGDLLLNAPTDENFGRPKHLAKLKSAARTVGSKARPWPFAVVDDFPDDLPEDGDSLAREAVLEMNSQAQMAFVLNQEFRGRHIFVYGLGWHFWDGKCWKRDIEGKTEQGYLNVLGGVAVRTISTPYRAEIAEKVTGLSGANGISSALKIASKLPNLARTADQLDAQPMLLNVANGVLDLETLELRPHDPALMMTKTTRARYRPGVSWHDTRWAAFLEEILPDQEVRSYLQRHTGMSLLGEQREHTLLILTGTGRNGKGVFYEAVNFALGAYAGVFDPGLLLAKGQMSAGDKSALMKLRGLRRAVTSEVEKGFRLSASVSKRLVGGDRIEAKYMGQDVVEYDPTHTLTMVTNDLPVVPPNDDALWMRIKVVPFDQQFQGAKQDPKLSQKLHSEVDAILAWAVEGLREYQRVGLAEPKAVQLAVHQYQRDNDDVESWLEDCTEQAPKPTTKLTDLQDSYELWCFDAQIKPLSRRDLRASLDKRGIRSKSTNVGLQYFLSIRDDTTN